MDRRRHTRLSPPLARRALGASLALLATLLLGGAPRPAAAQDRPKLPQLLLRVDDIGMNHAVNRALADVLETGLPVSVSLMFACPWYQEAVALLKDRPQVSVGVHLTLNSEWRYYKWGPVLGREAVPSLVDGEGFFLGSTAELLERRFDLGEVERELSAQIERALRSGLRIDYIDHHMGTAVATEELRALLERLAAKYHLGISRYFGEAYHTLFAVAPERKESELRAIVAKLAPAQPSLVVIHAARPDPEMSALVDLNNAAMNTAEGAPLASRHRQAELEMLTSPGVRELLRSGQLELITYRDLIAERGLGAMKRPGPGG